MRWKNYARILLCGFALSCNALPALANFTITQGSGLAIFSIDSGTTPAGTGNCAAATTECTASIPIDKSGTPLFATGNAGLVTGTGGTFPATQATAANLNATVVGTGTFAVQATLQASATTAIGKVDPNTIGNWGLAASTQNGTTPTNAGLVMGQFNTTPTTITSGNVSPLQMDNAGNLLVNIKAGAGSGGTAITDNAAFTTGTTSETPIGCYAGTPSATANHSTIVACTTAGSVHTTVDNATTTIGNNTDGVATSSGGNSPVVNYNYGYNGTSWDRLQVDGSKFLKVIAQAGSSVIGKVGVDQTTFGTTNGVVSAAVNYQAVAASQTAATLQTSTGATGDYLSHCTIYPASTSPGAVTVFDSTNTAANSAVLFAGGASSASNLVPFAVPVGAKSVNGAWKVTTGASVSVVCEGKFS